MKKKLEIDNIYFNINESSFYFIKNIIKRLDEDIKKDFIKLSIEQNKYWDNINNPEKHIMRFVTFLYCKKYKKEIEALKETSKNKTIYSLLSQVLWFYNLYNKHIHKEYKNRWMILFFHILIKYIQH